MLISSLNHSFNERKGRCLLKRHYSFRLCSWSFDQREQSFNSLNLRFVPEFPVAAYIGNLWCWADATSVHVHFGGTGHRHETIVTALCWTIVHAVVAEKPLTTISLANWDWLLRIKFDLVIGYPPRYHAPAYFAILKQQLDFQSSRCLDISRHRSLAVIQAWLQMWDLTLDRIACGLTIFIWQLSIKGSSCQSLIES